MMDIRNLTQSDWPLFKLLIKQLNPALSEEELENRYSNMQTCNYKAIGLFVNQHLIAMSGYWVGFRFYCGKYLEIDNFVVDAEHRGKGYGQQLLKHLEEISHSQDANIMVLDAYIDNEKVHAFCQANNFVKLGYHMVKTLNNTSANSIQKARENLFSIVSKT